MKKEKVNLHSKFLVGISVKTNNKNEFNPETAKIGKTVGYYLEQQLANKIKHRKTPGVTYAVYTDYESNEHGNYSYFIGEEVDNWTDQDTTEFTILNIPHSSYQKFTTNPGNFPHVVINAWQAIWQMNEADLGAKRKYIADFEVYDHRASDPSNTVIDIYIGI